MPSKQGSSGAIPLRLRESNSIEENTGLGSERPGKFQCSWIVLNFPKVGDAVENSPTRVPVVPLRAGELQCLRGLGCQLSPDGMPPPESRRSHISSAFNLRSLSVQSPSGDGY